ncbi:pectinesterase family protein [Ruminococcus flavefaciens]|uniref:Pectate lyase n=1 Tax=Ruminococcus flavefaciens TaxID=1265 RepID=A0A315XVS7_RUMFL|nr:pectinesterase family protein [Ruminococcus flavefaciens]PWJ11307.1 pectate lyase [Ruminococcus flavefaciens]SSA50869.1 Pectate lyase [Ruminococcus flavefaciens]
MKSRTEKLTLQLLAFVSALAVLLAALSVFPTFRAAAAGTDLYVGYSGRSNNFSTVQAAVDRAASLNPSSEQNRVTIHIAPGTYRQQVIVQTPYISFVNDEPSKGDVVLTWYYGIGYKYYSANSKGYYDGNLAASKSGKNASNYRWGATVQLWPKATYFKAENIVFENSFNRYITQEELADGVECTNETLKVQRTNGVDVKSKAYTERAAALSVDTGYAEFLNCKFLSSQDTLYTGGSPQYYRNCLIEGQTDYIFGGSNAVFDNCELRWKGYSSGSVGGYITAAREQGSPYTGYLFKDCKVTANPDLTVAAGYLGRPWAQSAKVLFVNTTLQNSNMITAAGWYSMSGVQPETVDGFKENGTKLTNGQKVDLSQRKGHTVSDSDAANINIKNYLNNWTPTFLNGSGSSQQPQQPSGNVDGAIKLCGGWFEEAFVEFDSSKLGNNVKVSYAQAGSSDYTAVDSQLIRGTRVDIPGLKGNTEYNISLTGSNGSASCTVKTMAFDRSGYAHWNTSDGVGAYNSDGTLRSGANVIYVTNSNKDSITYGGQTGLYNIFYSGKPKNVVFRIIGGIDVPSGAKANDGKQNDGSSMLYLQNAENVTIEGIGYDADLKQWGFEMKRSKGCEVRNLWLGNYPDDGVSMSGSSDSKSLHMWIHNNTIEKGYNAYAGNGTVDADKADGDGSLDIKWTEYVTVSYNVFQDCHKTSLVGGGTSHMQDWITYHHNWFNNTESRNPRARNAHIHSYNNYFYNNKQYGIGASYNSKVFSEANYYQNTYLPLDAVNMGSDAYSGTIKSYGDKFDGCNMGSGLAYQIVNSRTDKAYINNLKSGGDGYDNFDTDSSKIYGSYNVQSADAAKAEVTAYAGRMQNKAYNAGSVSQGGEPVVIDQPMKSALIARLDVKDASYGAQWSIAESFGVGDKAFGDREHVIASVPAVISGGEHIITACNSKNTDSDLAVITAAKDITVYVALDERVTTPPSWLGSFTKTGDVVEINDSEAVRPFDVYAKEIKAGETLTLGTNGMSGACMNYTAFVAETPYATPSQQLQTA